MNRARRPRARRGAARWLLAAAVVYVIAGCGKVNPLSNALGGGGGGGNGGSAVEGAVEAFGSVIESDASGQAVTQARLDVATVVDGQVQFVAGVAEPRLAIGDVEVPLLTTSVSGVFETNSVIAPEIAYVGGATYTFRFSVVRSGGELERYEASVVAPDAEPVVEVRPDFIYYAQEPLDVTLLGMGDGGAIRVVGPDETVTYDTSALSAESEAGLDAVRSLLEGTRGPNETIPGRAFPIPGAYEVQVTSVTLAVSGDDGLSASLGSLSWFGAGTRVDVPLSME